MKAHLQERGQLDTPALSGLETGSARDPVSAPGPLATAIGTLADHDALLERFATMHLDRVRHMRPLAGEDRADTLPRARRREAELPKAAELEVWYRGLRLALDAAVDDRRSRILVETLLRALRGRPAEAIVVDAFVLALTGARMSPHLVAGAVKRAIATCSVRPSAAAFLRIAEAHRAEVRAALNDVVRTMGLRKERGEDRWPERHLKAVKPIALQLEQAAALLDMDVPLFKALVAASGLPPPMTFGDLRLWPVRTLLYAVDGLKGRSSRARRLKRIMRQHETAARSRERWVRLRRDEPPEWIWREPNDEDRASFELDLHDAAATLDMSVPLFLALVAASGLPSSYESRLGSARWSANELWRAVDHLKGGRARCLKQIMRQFETAERSRQRWVTLRRKSGPNWLGSNVGMEHRPIAKPRRASPSN